MNDDQIANASIDELKAYILSFSGSDDTCSPYNLGNSMPQILGRLLTLLTLQKRINVDLINSRDECQRQLDAINRRLDRPGDFSQPLR